MTTITTTINHGVTLGATYVAPLTITATGAVKNNGTGYSVVGGNTGDTVVNQGTVVATGSGNYGGLIAIYLTGANSGVNNQGKITAAGNGIAVYNTATISNSGTITSGHWGLATRGATTLNNIGTISGTSNGVNIQSYGGASTITNSGRIVGSDGMGISHGAGVINNSATIYGTYGPAIALSAGGFVSNSAAGLIKSNGNGNSPYTALLLYGGTTANVTNSGTILGFEGVQFFNGGVYSAAATLTNYGGTILGTGGTAIVFGTTSDKLIFSGVAPKIQGTVDGGGGANTLEFAFVDFQGTLTGVNAEFANFTKGTVDSGARGTLAGSVTFDSSVTIANSGTLVEAGTLVNAGRITTTSTLLPAALSIASGGILTNAATGLLAGVRAITASSGSINVSNLGTLQGSGYTAIQMAGGVIVNGATNNTTAAITALLTGVTASSSATITNFGTISTTGTSATNVDAAVVLGAGGSVNNAGVLLGIDGIIAGGAATIVDTGTILAETIVPGGNVYVGVALNAGGSVSVAAGGYIYSQQQAIAGSGSAVTLSNSGKIVGKSTGVRLASGGSVSNTGTITGGAASYGVFIGTAGGAAGTVSNYGYISGIRLLSGGTIVDGGTISRTGKAVYLGGTGSNLLILTHGYHLTGAVTAAAAASNTLELRGTAATASVTATYSSLALTNFSTIAFAAGNSNYADLKITNNTTLPGTLVNFTGKHDAVDLTALAFVSASSSTQFDTASDKLTVSNGTNSVTLQLGSGSYTGIGWQVTNDGSGGSKIIANSVQTGFNIHNETELNSAFSAIGVGGTYSQTNTNFTLSIANSFSLASAVSALTLASGSSVTLAGGGFTLTGSGAAQNFLNSTGPITLQNLDVANAVATAISGAHWTFAGTDTLGAGTTLNNSGSINAGFGVLYSAGKFNNAGTLNGEITLIGTGQFTNVATGYISGAVYSQTGSNVGTVANLGTLSASSGYGIYLFGAGNVTNAAGALINGPTGVRLAGTSATVGNLGTINAYQSFPHSYAVILRHGGLVTNGQSGNTTGEISGYYGIGISGGGGTVVNDATIISTGSAAGTHIAGVLLNGGGNLTNGESGVSGAFITGANYGVEIAGNGSVSNRGTIRGVNDGVAFTGTGTVVNYGGITATTNSGVIDEASGVVTNNGTITGAGIGINIRDGVVTNAATALASGGQYGVAIFLGGTLTNAGTINATTSTGVGAMFASANNTLFDSGSISGDTIAVEFGGTGTNALVLERGFAFHGAISASSSATNTLELLGTSTANAVTATYNSLGLTNFPTIAFAPGNGNYADLKITNNATLPGTITNFTGTHDTIDLTALAFVTGSSTATFNTTSHQLTISNGTSSVGLQLGSGSYTGQKWTVRNDGSGGSQVLALTSDFLIHNETELNSAFSAISVGGTYSAPNVGFNLTLANSFTLNSVVSGLSLASGSSVLINGAGFTLSGNGTAQNFINSAGPITLDNLNVANAVATVISGAYWAVIGTDTIGSTLTNSGTMSVTGTLTDAGTLINNGSIQLGNTSLTLASGGYLLNGLAGAITGIAGHATNFHVAAVVGPASGTGTVANLGTVSDSQFSFGVRLAHGGSVTNGSTADTTALIESYTPIYIQGAAGTVSNFGTLESDPSAAGRTAVDLVAGGTISNGAAGSTAALISGTYNGLAVSGVGTVTNFGTISGGTGRGIVLANGGTVTDAGKVVGGGGTAILFAGSVSNRLVLDPGYSITGIASGGTTPANSTLELSSGASAGTLASLGSKFRGFATTTIDSNASWVFSGSDTVATGYSLINSGTLTVAGTLVDAGVMTNSGSLVVDPPVTVTGTFINNSAVSAPGTYTAFYVATGGVLSNTSSGSIGAGGYGITAKGTVSITNLGTVTSTSSSAVGVIAGSVINGTSGSTSALISGKSAGVVAKGAATITNYAAITGTSSGIFGNGGAATVLNSGSIGANVTNGTGVALNTGGVVSNQSSGTITGADGVYANAAATVTNAGSVGGSTLNGIGVGLSAGGAAINLSGGIITGGNVGIQAKSAASVTNSGSIAAVAASGYGIDLAAGGSVTNQSGGVITGRKAVYALVDATIVNAGTIQGTAASGIGVELRTGGTLTNQAGGTISGTYASVYFDAGSAHRLVIDPGAVFVGKVNGGNTIGATAVSTLELASAASAGTLSSLGSKYVRFQQITIDSGASWSLTGSNTLIAGQTLTDSGRLTDAGTLTNAGLISASPLTVTGVFINSGTANGGTGNAVYLANGGVVTNAVGGVITGSTIGITAAGTATIDNLGTIGGTTFAAIRMASGIVTNGTSASILGSGYGVRASGVATVTNYGFITASNQDGVFLAGGGSLTNNATIAANDYGALLYGAGTITNRGTISAGGGGIITNNGPDVVVNSGLIVGSNTTAGTGIILQAGGTVIDSGTIQGAYAAVGFRGTASNLLILENGYKLTGAVVGSTSASSNTLELLGTSSANAVTATFNSLGLTNFSSVGFAAGTNNYADLKITNNATLPGTIVNFAGNHDTVDLTALAFVTASSHVTFNGVAHQLTVTNGTSSVTLQLGSGSYTNASWTVANDGSGGTDILSQAIQAGFTIHNETELNAAFAAISTGGTAATTNTPYTLTFANSFSLNSAVAGLSLASGSSVTLDGAGFTLSSGGGAYGFINGTGPITVESLDIAGVVASAVSGASWTFAGTNTLGSGTTLTNSGTLDVAGGLTDAGTVTGGITLLSAASLLSVASGGYVGPATGTLAAIGGAIGSVINRGSIGGSATVVSVGSLLNYGSISATGTLGVAGYARTITNFGTITDTGALGFAVEASSTVVNGSSSVTNALINGAHDGIVLHGFAAGGTVINYGTVIGSSFVGVLLQGTGGTLGVSNSGTIISGGSYAALAVENQPGFATVNNTGVIQVTTGNSYGIDFRADGSLTNSGLIASPGVALAIGNGFTAVVTNSSTLSGSKGFEAFGTANQTLIDSGAIVGTSGTAATFASGNDLLQFQPSASAFIQGIVNGGGGTNTLEFASGATVGTLTGSNANFVNFQNMQIDAGASWQLAGNNTFGNSAYLIDRGSLTIAGTVVGNIYGEGQAPLVVTAGGYLSNNGTKAAFYAIYADSGTVVNFGIIAASGSAPINDGIRFKGAGSVSNSGTITGHYGVVAYGYLTVTNSGTIGSGSLDGVFLRGGGSVSNTGVVLGSVAIKGPAASVATTINNSGTIRGQDGIALSAANTAASTVIDSGTIIGLSGPAVQFGSGTNVMKFTPGNAFIQGGVVGGASAVSNTLEFASGASPGTLTGSGAYFTNFGTGTVDAGAKWTLAGNVTFGANVTMHANGTLIDVRTLVNDGHLQATNYKALQLGAGGYLRNDASGVIDRGTIGGSSFNAALVGVGSAPTIVNYGTILNNQGDTAIYLKAGGTITNGSSNATSALITANVGIYLHGSAATVNNYATISGYVGAELYDGGVIRNGVSGSTAALIAASQYGAVLDHRGTLSNYGTITASSQFGVRMRYGGLLTNAGRITGNSGIVVQSGQATVVNSGRIVGTGGDGVSLAAGGTITDSGRIAGTGTAVAFGGTAANLLILENGYSLSGRILGSASASNTLELLGTSAANAVTATYNSLGLTNFATIAFATGVTNYAALKITNNATLPGTIANFTGNHDTIDLTALAFVTASSHTAFNSVAHQLTVTNGTSSVTLQLGSGSYTNVSWTVANDGSGGTDILAQAIQSSFTIHNETELNSAFAAISTGGTAATTNTPYTLTFANSFALNSAVSTLALASGSSVTIDGAGFTLSGGGGAFGFINGAGPITVENLDIANAVATVVSGGSWTLAGTITIGTGTTLTNSGSVVDTGTLTDAGTMIGGITLASAAAQFSVATGGYFANGLQNIGVLGSSGGIVINQGTLKETATSGPLTTGYYAINLQNGGSVNNSGSIRADSLAAIRADNGASITNSGFIDAGVDDVLADGGVNINNSGVMQGPGAAIVFRNGDLTLTNTGVLNGGHGIVSQNGQATITNSGTIGSSAGDGIDLSKGGTISNAPAGVIFALGTYVALSVTGGTAVINNAGTISGSRAVSFQSTGTTAYTIVNSGTISGAVSFGAGNDLLKLQPGNAFIRGLVNGGSGTNTLEFASSASAGTLTGSGAFFTNFGAGTVDAGATWTLAGNVTFGSNVTIGANGKLIDAGTVINDGRLQAANYGALQLGAGGYLRNDASGVISRGTIGGTSFNAAILGVGSAPTIANFGTIANSSGDAAIYLQVGGIVTNGAPTATSALITANVGVYLHGSAAAVNNYATISGAEGVELYNSGVVRNGVSGSTTALISGTQYGALLDNRGTLSNYGTITASSEFGVRMRYGGSLGNAGHITGNSGIVVQSGRATVTNSGSIVGTGGAGISLAAGGTITDSGRIAGSGTAISFGGTAANLLILENGYSLSGQIFGSATASNALELLGTSAANAVTATYSSLGLTNFAAIGFAPGNSNYATLKITNNATLPATITNFVGLHDTIDLTALDDSGNNATTNFNTATNKLTITAGTASVALQLGGGSYAGIHWVANNDGSNGTDVTLATTVPPVITGTRAGQSVNDNATDQPFSGVTITDSNTPTQTETLTITLSNGGTPTDADGTLSGTGLVKSGTGIYTLSAANAAAASVALDSLVFTPTANQVSPGGTVTTGFKISVVDAIGQSASDSTTTVIASSVNDPPTISGAKAGQAVNDNATINPFASVAIGDPDLGASETLTIALSGGDANGSLSGSGLTKSGVGTYTLTVGTPAVVTAALDALVFTPTAHEVAPGSTITTTMTLSVTDGIVGAPTTDSTTKVVATAINDPPTISGAKSGQTVNDNATINPFSTVTIDEVDIGQTETVTIVLSDAANGELSNLGAGSFNNGTYTVSGSASAVTAAVDALVFTPTSHQVPPGNTINTGFTIGVTDSAGASVSDATTSVIATASHNDPSIIRTSGGTSQNTTDLAPVQPFSNLIIIDADSGQTETVTVTLSNTANGTLSNLGGGVLNNGTYTVVGSDAAVTAALNGLVFTPTPHQVVPGSSVTTDFTINITDTAGDNATDNATSVVATATNNAPSISGAIANQGAVAQATVTPFASIVISDVNFGATDNVTIALSDTSGGTFSNLSGGSFNNGTYVVSGTPSVATAAIDALRFTSAAPSSGFIRTTGFTLAVTGTGGTVSDTTTTLTAVQQVFGLASLSPTQITISVSSDGTGFAAQKNGLVNEAVVLNPVNGGSYVLPAGYQAGYLGGSANATLTDSVAGGAVLVGNSGNDTLVAMAGNDTILGGRGSNLMSAANGGVIVSSGAADTISALGGPLTVQSSGNGALVFGDFTSVAGGLRVVSTGGQATISAGNSTAAINASGGNALVYGGFGPNAHNVSLVDTGRSDTISAGDSTSSVTLGGSNALLFGRFGNAPGALQVLDTGSNDTISAGSSPATITANGTDLLVFGGSGPLNFVGGSGNATVSAGTGATSVTGGNAGSTLYGSAGSAITYSGSAGILYAAGSGNETLNASNSSGANELVGGGDANGANSIVGGVGNDVIIAGAGAETLVGGSGSDIFSFVSSLTRGSADLILDFTSNDVFYLTGYGADQASTALAAATSSDGNTTITLSDNTRVTFVGVISASTLQGHVFSF